MRAESRDIPPNSSAWGKAGYGEAVKMLEGYIFQQKTEKLSPHIHVMRFSAVLVPKLCTRGGVFCKYTTLPIDILYIMSVSNLMHDVANVTRQLP